MFSRRFSVAKGGFRPHAYQSFHPHSEKKIGRPVLLSASRMALYSAKAVVWLLDAEQESSFK